MAQYTNLTSLNGLLVGDVVIYNTATDIDLAGCKVKFEVIGNRYNWTYFGGYSCGTMSAKSNTSVSFNTTYSSCFYLTNGNGTDWRYNRFIVAGNCSDGASGGGLTGNDGSFNSSYKFPKVYSKGGSQTAAGATSYGSNTQNYVSPAGFGNGGTGGYYENYGSNNGPMYYGGAGWYGGGGGSYERPSGSYYYNNGSAGGSGYVLTTTSSKPTGYMTNNDFILEDTVLTTGGAQSASANYANTYNIGVITIIEIGFDPTTQTKIITNNLGVVTETVINRGDTITNPGEPTHDSKYLFVCWCSDSALTTEYTFGGTATSDFIYLYAKYYQYVSCKTYINDNNEIVPCKFYRWNGTSFEQIQIKHIETVT